MKYFKKLDTYLLENHPVLWASRFVFLISSAIALWLFALFFGFVTFGAARVHQIDIYDHYFDSLFVAIHVIIVIILVVIWVVQFYKHNALKSLYPIKKWHFQKLFLLILVPFTLFFTAYYPFSTGTRWKADTYLDNKAMAGYIEVINKAAPFLVINTSDYDFDNRVYPAPFPCTTLRYDKNEGRWDQSNLHEVLEKNDKGNVIKKRDFISDNHPYTELGISKYQFLDLEYISGKSECYALQYVVKIHELDASKYKIARNSVLNYSNIWISENNYYFEFERFPSKRESTNTDYDDVSDEGLYRKKYATGVNEIVYGADTSAIRARITEIMNALNKMSIDHQLYPDKIAKYLLLKDFRYLSSITEDYPNSNTLSETLKYQKISESEYNSFPFQKQFEIHSGQYIDNEGLITIYKNLRHVNKDHIFSRFSKTILFFPLALALFFVILYVVDLKAFLLSIPVWGVLLVLTGMMLTYFRHYNSNTVFPATFFGLMLLIIIFNWWFLRDPKLSIKPLSVSMPMTMIAIPAAISLLLFTIHFACRYTENGPCDFYDEHELFDGFLTNPYLHFFGLLFAILSMLSILKPFQAKAE